MDSFGDQIPGLARFPARGFWLRQVRYQGYS